MAENGQTKTKTHRRNGQHANERAEQLVEEWSRRIGRVLAGAAARTREEAEDIWAEAQSLRRGARR
jgi:hypothetical protein